MRYPSRAILFGLLVFAVGCGGGSGSNPTNPQGTITFSSTPGTSAGEGAQYVYQITATSSTRGAVTFQLTSAPAGATLSGNTITWTPTHEEARTANAFTVTATSASATPATQTWSVTPTGNVNITNVVTYWGPNGNTTVTPTWNPALNLPAAFVPQSDGSLQTLTGSPNPDGSFTIPNVPGGYFWLQLGAVSFHWTSASDFDYGTDVAGLPVATTSESTTTFDFSISGLQPSTTLDNFVEARPDSYLGSVVPLPIGLPGNNSSTLNLSVPYLSSIDWSKVDTFYFTQYVTTTSGSFTGFTVGPSATLAGLSLTDGGTNNLTAALEPSPGASIPLQIAGDSWAAIAATSGPGATVASSDYLLQAQPYVTDRYALQPSTGVLGPGFPLLWQTAPPSGIGIINPFANSCGVTLTLVSLPLNFGLPPITTPENLGTVPYGDPYPTAWPRYFEYCQLSTVTLARPNSSETDTFAVGQNEVTALPAGGAAENVQPILSNVQSPTINGNSFLQTATLNTTTVNLTWTAPATGQPAGYVVAVYELSTLPTGQMGYLGVGSYTTAKTTVNVPFLTAGNTYVFAIEALADAKANVETSPRRHQVPIAHSVTVSAPFVISSGATANSAARRKAANR